MTTDKTIKSKYQPKQTNVTWVDLSGLTPVEKHFINGRWVEIGGGSKGSGNSSQQNPGYTATKSYNTYLEQQDIQTELNDNYAFFEDYDGSLIDTQLVVGDVYKVTFDGVEYELVCSYDDNNYYYLGAAWDSNLDNYDFSTYPFRLGTYFNGDNPTLYLCTQEAGNYSVKVEEVTIQVTTTPEFEKAVGEAAKESGTKLIVDDVTVYMPTRSGDVRVTRGSEWFNKIDSGEYPDLIIDNNDQILGRKIFENKYLTQYLHTVRVNEKDYKFINYEHFDYVESGTPGEDYYKITVKNSYA